MVGGVPNSSPEISAFESESKDLEDDDRPPALEELRKARMARPDCPTWSQEKTARESVSRAAEEKSKGT
jgi:hypothetical protein